MSVAAQLEKLGIELPTVPAPVAAYVAAVKSGNLVRTSGQLPLANGELVCQGRLGDSEVSEQAAYDAARQAALNALAAAAEIAGGVDNLARVVKVTGYVASAPNFHGQPAVINGASDLFQGLFGKPHARAAVGVAALPLNACVEVEVDFELS